MQADKTNDVRQQLVAAKKKLVGVLGDNEKAYWANMKSWFKHRITKEEFDGEARKLLPKESAHLHNRFLLAVLTKCHVPSFAASSKETSTSQASSKMKKSKRIQAIKRKYDHRFAVNQTHVEPPAAASGAQQNKPPPQPVKMCAKSLLMPSADEMRSYVIIIAWELGLDDVSDDVVALSSLAVRVFLKNMLSAIFSRRSAYKTVKGNFKYAMGCEAENPYLGLKHSSFYDTSTATPELKMACHAEEQNKIEELGREALDSFGSDKKPVDMYDLQHTLHVLIVSLERRCFLERLYLSAVGYVQSGLVFGSSLIPSHTVHALASERIVASLWHPDHEEIKQDEIMKKMINAT